MRTTQTGAVISVTLLDGHKDSFGGFTWLVMLFPASHDSIMLEGSEDSSMTYNIIVLAAEKISLLF